MALWEYRQTVPTAAVARNGRKLRAPGEQARAPGHREIGWSDPRAHIVPQRGERVVVCEHPRGARRVGREGVIPGFKARRDDRVVGVQNRCQRLACWVLVLHLSQQVGQRLKGILEASRRLISHAMCNQSEREPVVTHVVTDQLHTPYPCERSFDGVAKPGVLVSQKVEAVLVDIDSVSDRRVSDHHDHPARHAMSRNGVRARKHEPVDTTLRMRDSLHAWTANERVVRHARKRIETPSRLAGNATFRALPSHGLGRAAQRGRPIPPTFEHGRTLHRPRADAQPISGRHWSPGAAGRA